MTSAADRAVITIVGRATEAALGEMPDEASDDLLVAVAATLITEYCIRTGVAECDAIQALQGGVSDGLAAHYAKARRA
jgi:hypothetical protein